MLDNNLLDVINRIVYNKIRVWLDISKFQAISLTNILNYSLHANHKYHIKVPDLFYPSYSLFNCENSSFHRPCLVEKSSILIGLSITTFIIFTILIVGQSFLRFEFIEDQKVFKRIKSSSFISVGLIFYVGLNEITFYFL